MICPHCHKEIDGEDLKKRIDKLKEIGRSRISNKEGEYAYIYSEKEIDKIFKDVLEKQGERDLKWQTK